MADDGIPEFEEGINYEDLVIEREIGKGGFGTVYAANYFGSLVAVKQITGQSSDEENVKYLKREVAILKGLRHPNVVQFIGVSYRGGNLHIVTEYIAGGNLRTWLKREDLALPWSVRIGWSNDVASAMAFLHSRSIIFRDLKSKNILIDEQRAKICDFGLARARDSKAESRPMTMCGTDEWMAPEVILGMPYDTPADAFSFGIVLFEIISRQKVSLSLQRLPKDAFGLDEDKAKSVVPKDCPAEFSAITFDCCNYEPEQRPTFKALVQNFAALMKKFPTERLNSSLSLASSIGSTPASPRATAPAPAPTPAPIPVSPRATAPTPAPKAQPSSSKSPSPTATPAASPAANKATAKPAPASPKPSTTTSTTTSNRGTTTSQTSTSTTSTSNRTNPTPSSPKPSSSASSTSTSTSTTSTSSRTNPAPSSPKPSPSPSSTKAASSPTEPVRKPAVTTPIKPVSISSSGPSSSTSDLNWSSKPQDGTVLKPSELKALAAGKKAAAITK